ncbi:MAG: hypothetical protein HDR21_08400 [Lachnospiraceae bacterium]|nr:hypothetical protein [Lachnospiraceae bacterium]
MKGITIGNRNSRPGRRISPYHIMAGVCMLLAVFLWAPTWITTLYTYPVQDDFGYALQAKTCMEEGHNLLTMSFICTVKYYREFSGYFMSTFLMFLFSGMIDCSIWGIRIFCLINCLMFMGALYLFLHTFLTRVMGLDGKWTAPLFLFLTACMTCVHYFTEHEDIFWFCASVIYLSLLIMMFVGVSLFIYAVDRGSPGLLAAAAVFGFLTSGASLNVTAFCCILYLLVALWGMARGKKLYSLIGMGVTLAGALINAVCPANFARHGEPLTIGGVVQTVAESVGYLFHRYRQLLGFPVFCAILVTFILLLIHTEGKSTFKFPLPAVFTPVMLLMPAAVIFPVMLGYSSEIYKIVDRAIFISDLAIYLFLLMILCYWRGWISRKFGKININSKLRWLTAAVAVVVLIVGVKKSVIPYIPVVKQVNDFRSGVYENYADWCVSIYTQVKESEDEIVTVTVPPIHDTTCLINPKFYIGVYDPEEEYANRTIASFYGKRAVYVLVEEEQ